jgi:hypothetical protein
MLQELIDPLPGHSDLHLRATDGDRAAVLRVGLPAHLYARARTRLQLADVITTTPDDDTATRALGHDLHRVIARRSGSGTATGHSQLLRVQHFVEHAHRSGHG